MANYGLQVRNSTGNYVIDGTYSNFALRSKGSVVLSNRQSTGAADWWYADITVLASMQVPALRSSAKIMIRWATISGSFITYRIWGDTQNAVVDYWLFDIPSNDPSADHFGLRVWNAVGQLIFDSGKKYMRVLDFITGGAGQSELGFTRTYGNNVAVIQSQGPMDAVSLNVNPGNPTAEWFLFFNAGCFRVSGTSATFTYDQILVAGPTSDPSATPDYSQYGYSYLVINVDNM